MTSNVTWSLLHILSPNQSATLHPHSHPQSSVEENSGIGICITSPLSLSTTNMSTFKSLPLGAKPNEVKRQPNNRKQMYASLNAPLPVPPLLIENEEPKTETAPPSPIIALASARFRIARLSACYSLYLDSSPYSHRFNATANQLLKNLKRCFNKISNWILFFFCTIVSFSSPQWYLPSTLVCTHY